MCKVVWERVGHEPVSRPVTRRVLLLIFVSIAWSRRRRTQHPLPRRWLTHFGPLVAVALVLASPPAHGHQFDGRMHLPLTGQVCARNTNGPHLGQFEYRRYIDRLQDPLVVARTVCCSSHRQSRRHDQHQPSEHDWLDVGLDLPATMFSGSSNWSNSSSTTQLGDLRIWTKAQAVNYERHGIDFGSLSVSCQQDHAKISQDLGRPDWSLTCWGRRSGGTSRAIGYRMLPTRTFAEHDRR